MHRSVLSLALCLTTVASLAWCGRAESKPNPASAAPLVPPSAPKSTFVDEPGFGRDPFFPNSTVRPQVAVHNVEPDLPRLAIPDWVTLKGISVLKDKKLAIVNTVTVAEGEDFHVKNAGQVVHAKLLEVKERSVVITVNGVTKELPLRAGFN